MYKGLLGTPFHPTWVAEVAPSASSRVPLGWPARLLCRGVKLKQRLVSGLLLAASAILFLTLVRITGVRQLPPFASPAQGWVPSHSKGVAGGPSAQQPAGPDPSGVLGKRTPDQGLRRRRFQEDRQRSRGRSRRGAKLTPHRRAHGSRLRARPRC
ncbi:hypothetical protein MTO96_020483 [Rhipicephalus appendiculatus]